MAVINCSRKKLWLKIILSKAQCQNCFLIVHFVVFLNSILKTNLILSKTLRITGTQAEYKHSDPIFLLNNIFLLNVCPF